MPVGCDRSGTRMRRIEVVRALNLLLGVQECAFQGGDRIGMQILVAEQVLGYLDAREL